RGQKLAGVASSRPRRAGRTGGVLAAAAGPAPKGRSVRLGLRGTARDHRAGGERSSPARLAGSRTADELRGWQGVALAPRALPWAIQLPPPPGRCPGLYNCRPFGARVLA